MIETTEVCARCSTPIKSEDRNDVEQTVTCPNCGLDGATISLYEEMEETNEP